METVASRAHTTGPIMALRLPGGDCSWKSDLRRGRGTLSVLGTAQNSADFRSNIIFIASPTEKGHGEDCSHE